MKLLINIHEKYKETEIHICSDRKSEAVELRNLLDGLLLEKLTGYKNQEAQPVASHEIVRIYSENKRVYLRTCNDNLEVRERLYVLEESLREHGFVRISNSEIVNVSKISKLDMSYTGTIKMYMNNGDETYVSRRYVSRIKEVLK